MSRFSIKQKFYAILENLVFDNFFEVMACRLLGRDTGLTVYALGDKRIIVDHAAGDQSGTKRCLASRIYRDLLEQIELPSKPNILDLGANGGGFTLLCELEFGPLGRVLSVEFNPDTYRRLWFNLKSNISHGVEVLNAAVAGEDGTLVVPDRKGSTSDRPRSVEGRAGIEIEAITLDTLIERHFEGLEIDLCKIDIEGAEFEVLLSPRATRLGGIRNLIIEIHPSAERSSQELDERLAQAGLALRMTTNPPGEDGELRFYCRGSRPHTAARDVAA